ncbi:MAG: alkaline phosphatase family protein [Lapillicoccus sp.]
MDENTKPTTLDHAKAPYIKGLMASCGSEQHMHAAAHPSQPNYMAATSGVSTAVGAQSSANNIFNQLNGNWKSYEESMGSNCGGSRTTYQKGHNPAFWYTDLRSPVNYCGSNDLPLTEFVATSLPAFSWVTPNQCHNMHYHRGCPGTAATRVTTGDTWLSTFLPQVLSSPDYLAGHILVLLTWDEGEGVGTTGEDCADPATYTRHPSCDIPTVVMSAYITPGATDASDQSLYTLMGTAQDILGLPRINGSATHPASLRPGLSF